MHEGISPIICFQQGIIFYFASALNAHCPKCAIAKAATFPRLSASTVGGRPSLNQQDAVGPH